MTSDVALASSTRQDIVDEAGRLFATEGIAATTMRQIASAVGILAGSIYHHFDSKEAIVEEILDGALQDLEARYAEADEIADAAERLPALIAASFRSIDEHPHACSLYVNEQQYLASVPRFAALGEAMERARSIWMATLEQGRRDGCFREDIDAAVTFRFIFYPIWLTAGWHATSGHTIDELADMYTDNVMRALAC